MSNKVYTTNTASLKATTADIRNLDAKSIKLNGESILSKVLDERGDFVTDQDLWGTTITTDDNGVVHVSHKFLNNPNGQRPWNRSIKSVKDNKAYTSTDASGEPFCNIQTEMIKNGSSMFDFTPLTFFSSDLSSLVNGYEMFHLCTSLTSFNGDLSSLINGSGMFGDTPLTSFSGDLSSLVDGSGMFGGTSLTSFNGDLSSLVDGYLMFKNTSLTSFSEDLGSLIRGHNMFSNTHKRGYTISHYKMVDGVKTKVTEHFRAEGLTSFSGDLSSLQGGYKMFGDGSDVTYTNEEGVTETTKDITPLDEQSVMIIADTIKDLNGFTDWDSSVGEPQRGIIHIGYDSTVCDAAKIELYCTEIMNKGWTVYLNGTVQTTDEGIEGAVTTDEDGTTTVSPVPYYCKPVEVDQKDANWTDGEKYYIILGALKVFGDDIATYGMFTSIEDAAMNMGFTPYEYVEEETETIE